MSELPFLAVKNCSVAYGAQTALDDVSLELGRGERLAIIGESGSGKSTLALAIAGLLPGDAVRSGTIDFPGLERAARPGADIGFLFQDASGSLDPMMKIGDQIAEIMMSHRGMGWIAARVEAAQLLDRVRIPKALARLDDYPHQFSGGQKQRIALAAALAGKPQLLIADEPTSALDTVTQRHIVDLLDELVREAALTLVFVTHDVALAAERADRIAVLRHGRIVETAATAGLLSSPAHAYSRALVALHLPLGMARPRRLPEIGEDVPS
ncbi:ABC transporter ATP-binding protein [Phyllobacterium sp. 0TCS1.6C]|uniref:ABC transporter ATP-binding protein n=1 Tax=unclassified Phyllobacterium TaxID=2638441 RepID=UPI0022643BB0|nr:MULTISPECIES: ABC transporter ATP-binding protein [unclassified Phyllobacterium]MCX8281331.1 ABC transporter ATP-binding protein [Phyllobacterium sp. 0TCS1.6C]MCX8296013.1 ABC transporter ATP-binding protein [Phyllobacterium sp. 0TCS1.6A]